MSQTTLTINGTPHTATIEPRTHLADFLREALLLTGTHLGCEHGVCGACTLLINGAPARSCITFAATCAGAKIQTIEGLQQDSIITALRESFSTHHALQCGYCTPGMLVTARDIILRLPSANDDRIRLELAGNLCRCTGYNGIVRAIRDVLDQHLTLTKIPTPALQTLELPKTAPLPLPPAPMPRPSRPGITQTLRIPIPPATLWPALENPALVASCVPGASIKSIEAGNITGEMQISFGPMTSHFTGTAHVTYAGQSGTIIGEGQDQMSKTKLSAQADFTLTEDGQNSLLTLAITYNLRGPLAQFTRGAIVQEFVTEIATLIAKNLTAKLSGAAPAPTARLSPLALALKILKRRLKIMLGRTPLKRN